MIPNELIRLGGRAIHARSVYRGTPWEEAPRWFRDGAEDDARLALEAAAGDIWDEAAEAFGMHYRIQEHGNYGPTNPYRTSENASAQTNS